MGAFEDFTSIQFEKIVVLNIKACKLTVAVSQNKNYKATKKHNRGTLFFYTKSKIPQDINFKIQTLSQALSRQLYVSLSFKKCKKLHEKQKSRRFGYSISAPVSALTLRPALHFASWVTAVGKKKVKMLLKSCCVALTLIIQLFCDQMSSNFSSSFFNSFCVQRINDLTYFIVIITSLYLYLHHPMITMKSAHGLHQCAVTFLSNLLFSIVLALLYWVRSTFCAHWTELQTAVMQREIHLSKLAV